MIIFNSYIDNIRENQSILVHRLLTSRWTCGRVDLNDSNFKKSFWYLKYKKKES